jgi:hypothetical protein
MENAELEAGTYGARHARFPVVQLTDTLFHVSMAEPSTVSPQNNLT